MQSFTNKKKEEGWKKAPCLKPLYILNSSVGEPLTKYETEVEDKHSRIQSENLIPIPIEVITFLKKL